MTKPTDYMCRGLTFLSLLLIVWGIGTDSLPIGFAGTALLGWLLVRGDW